MDIDKLLESLYNKTDRVSNLVEQMALANSIGDKGHFNTVKKEAADILLNIAQEIEGAIDESEG